eukprot:TRINITY_DN9503_c0_g1_i1.p1 TRINITY_DN9503_c0_g1~~TRINITY_DN9503_c0_g1_i1.p1  ORF type:complete len:436 (+),score=96.52 TRINITY_DN9503_c0_g1_i1:51-1358(+)
MAQQKNKEQISAVVIGHVDVGKSTTIGHLLFKCGYVSEKKIDVLAKESAKIGKQSYKYAWILDTLSSERTRGITVDISLCKIETEKKIISITDTPGQSDYIYNMLSGAAMAHVAVLCVAAAEGEFEVGIAKGGQTREHALLAFTLGIKQMIVVINKMDDKSVQWNQKRYDTIVTEVSAFLKKVGYNPWKILFIPISGWHGDNLTDRSLHSPWYKGPTLIEAFDNVATPQRVIDRPLRISVVDSYIIGGVGTVAVGRVATGVIRPEMSVTICPPMITTEARTVEIHNNRVTEAVPGDNVGVCLVHVSRREVGRGMIIGESRHPPVVVGDFVAQIIILDHPTIITKGYTPIISCHTAYVACAFSELITMVDRRTGRDIQDQPKSLSTGDAAIVRLVPTKPLCVDTFVDCPPLARFVIRDMGKVIGVGIIKTISRKTK